MGSGASRRRSPKFVRNAILGAPGLREAGDRGDRAGCCLSIRSMNRSDSSRASPSGSSAVARSGPLEGDGTLDHHSIGCRLRHRRGARPNQWRYQMAELAPPPEGIVLTHFIVSDDVERSRRFYTEVLGGRVVFSGESGEPTNVALANSFIVISVGGGPTDDKPSVILETPPDPTGSAASSIFGSKTSRLCTPNGAPGVLIS